MQQSQGSCFLCSWPLKESPTGGKPMLAERSQCVSLTLKRVAAQQKLQTLTSSDRNRKQTWRPARRSIHHAESFHYDQLLVPIANYGELFTFSSLNFLSRQKESRKQPWFFFLQVFWLHTLPNPKHFQHLVSKRRFYSVKLFLVLLQRSSVSAASATLRYLHINSPITAPWRPASESQRAAKTRPPSKETIVSLNRAVGVFERSLIKRWCHPTWASPPSCSGRDQTSPY